MNPATYNLLEAVVRATNKIADKVLDADAAQELRTDLVGKLTGVKVTMQREHSEDIVQDMAGVVIALSKFVLGDRPTTEPRVEQKHLQGALRALEQRFEGQHGSSVRAPEYELQHGGELREKEPEPVIYKHVCPQCGSSNIMCLDCSSEWTFVVDDGTVIAALSKGLSNEMQYKMTEKILAIWNELKE
jgi:hypothetical protein